MLIVPVPFFARSAGGFPIVTMTAASIYGGDYYGYTRAGGLMAAIIGAGGSLSSTLLPGAVTDGIFQEDGEPNVRCYFVGDTEALLVGCTGLKINSSVFPFLDAYYDSGDGWTIADFGNGGLSLTASIYTVQLV